MPRGDRFEEMQSGPPLAWRETTGRLILPPVLASLDRYHRTALDRLFGPSPPRSPLDQSLKFLFLCFTNRSGSNYLARLIGSTGHINPPEEAFNAPTVEEHARRERLLSLHDYVNFLGRRLCMNGWLTAKLGIEQVVMLTEAGVLDAIIDRTKFLLIERQDTAAQAVSRIVATQNGMWTSEHAATIPDDQLVYVRSEIETHRAMIAFQNAAFYRFFASNGLTPKHLAYEALVQSPELHLSEIGAWLGFEGFIGDPAAIGIRRQESAIKRAWVERYEQGG